MLRDEKNISFILNQINKQKFDKFFNVVQILIIYTPSYNSSLNLKCSEFNFNVKVIDSKDIGYGRAIKLGFNEVNKNALVVICDADGTYPINKLANYIKEIEGNNFFASINRFNDLKSNSMSKSRFLGNRLLTKLINFLYGLNLKDSQSGMWILDSEIISLLNFNKLDNGMSFSHEIKIVSNLDPNIIFIELDGEYHPRIENSTSNFNLIKDGLILFYNIISMKLILKSVLQTTR